MLVHSYKKDRFCVSQKHYNNNIINNNNNSTDNNIICIFPFFFLSARFILSQPFGLRQTVQKLVSLVKLPHY